MPGIICRWIMFHPIHWKRNITEITEETGYSNYGLRHILTDAHKEARKAITTALLHWHDTGNDGFLSLSWGTRPGSTVLNLNPGSCWGNDVPRDMAKEKEIQECAISRNNHGYSLLGSAKYYSSKNLAHRHNSKLINVMKQ